MKSYHKTMWFSSISKHVVINCLLPFTTLVNTAFYWGMWGLGWDLASKEGFTSSTTLSKMIETLPVEKLLYMSWDVSFSVSSIIIGLFVLDHELNKDTASYWAWEETQWCNECYLRNLTLFYFSCSMLRLMPIALIPLFDMSVEPIAHYICSFVGFGLSVGCTLILWYRRILTRHYLIFKIRFDGECEQTQGDKKYLQVLNVVILANGAIIVIELGLVIAFAITVRGEIECALMFLLVTDTFWQMFDFYLTK